ncbi:MAG TPA: FadR/GntR family transcriptional regulator [Gammaproteobacteria bacterium]|nr:FadR/GntR family transcriptional regulator [Gammaproteobacteria bacterium]
MASDSRHANLTRYLVEEIGSAIVRGDYAQSASLPIEAKLSEQFDASRSVLREAVKMLTAKGLVGSRPRRGTYVEPEGRWNLLDPDVLGWILQRNFSPRLMVEFLEVRSAIEPAASALAARNATAEDIADIKRALERMEAAARGDSDPLETDIAFHVAILRASRNRFFEQFAPLVETALRFTIRLTNRVKGVHMASVPDHRAIAEAIVGRDPEAAASATTHLLQEAIGLARLVEDEGTSEKARTSADQ